MPLSPGMHLGPYRILESIGRGGMGEVYRALDTNLSRHVAIKVLPDSVASSPDRLARFDREARTLAALNHPNIATIHGVERVDDRAALVMELIEGPTLGEHIAAKRPGLDDALSTARQIASALEAAHEQGIVHRDLKPANIKIRPDGTVKVLDFGLAKVTPAGAASAAALADTVTASATVPVPRLSAELDTLPGMVLGTAAYMSPEQARGGEVDRRTDIWAFGCILYEMLTGRRAFGGATLTETMVNVLEGQADLRALPAATPPAIRRLVRRCLERSPHDRVQHIGDARADIADVLAGEPDAAVARDTLRRSGRWRWGAVAAGTAVLAAAGVWFATGRGAPASQTATPIRFEVPRLQAPPFGALSRTIALSPDGSRLVYATQSSLRLRSIDGDDVSLPASGHQPFFSPDGEWVAFFSEEGLQRVPASGGAAELITPRGAGTERNSGGAWGDDGAIVVSVGGSLLRIRDGGTTDVLAQPDAAAGEIRYAWPEFLPGGRSLLFTVLTKGGPADTRIDVIDLTGERRSTLLRGYAARYVSTGHLVYAAGGRLHAVGFDPQRRELSGAPVRVEGVEVPETAGEPTADFAVSATGTLAYIPPVSRQLRTMAWVDRNGGEEPIPVPAMAYVYPRLSPDGTRMAVDILGATRDISVWDFARRVMTKITDGPTENLSPAWSPDSTRVFFSSDRAGGGFRVYSVAADGAGPAREEFAGPDSYVAQSMPAPNHVLAYSTGTGTRQGDVALISLTGGGSVRMLLGEAGFEVNAQVSPDGRWIVYQSDESGRAEVYIRPYPDIGGRREQISGEGGVQPLWGPPGSGELFYWTLDRSLEVVSVTLTPELRIGATRDVPLGDGYFPGTLGGAWAYQVSPVDGRLLLMKPVPGSGGLPPINVVVNWHEELKRLGRP